MALNKDLDIPWWRKAVSFAFLRGGFSRFFNNPERGTQESAPRNLTTEADVTVTDERSLQIATVFSAVRLISEIVGLLPLDVFRRNGDAREAQPNHPVSRLLETPNSMMTGQELIETMAMHVAGWGNAYSLVARSDRGSPQELWPLSPSRMEVKRIGFERIEYHYTHDAASKEVYQQRQVLHVKGFGGDGIVGLSPLGYARQALGVQIAAERYAAMFFRSGGRPSNIYMPDKPLTADQRQKFQEYFTEIGKTEQSGLWVIPSPGKWEQITISPEDAQMLVTRQFQVGEIARIFRVPLFLLMEMEKSTSWGTGLEQQNLAFLTYTVAPYLKRIENVMNRALFSESERRTHFVEFNVDALLRTDSKTRAEVQSILVQNGIFNRNEVRAMWNRRAYSAGEVYTAQSNLMPVDKLGEDPLAEATARELTGGR